jgi:subtilisin family serine protease
MRKRLVFLGLLVAILASLPAVAQAEPSERVLIRAPKPYGRLVAGIEALGGTVTYQYKYVDAIAAEVPRGALPALNRLVKPSAVTKDLIVPAPVSVDTLRGRSGLPRTGDETNVVAFSAKNLGAEGLAELAASRPETYLINNSIMNLDALHGGGLLGQGVVVAVIDSGIRPGFPHIDLDGSVIGCEDFVGDGLGCSNFANSGHGTFVAGMISSNVLFGFSTSSALRNSVLAHCPSCFVDPPTNTLIPFLGSAPLSSIYALRVFAPTGGAPSSRIIAAMERALELRELFNSGDPAGVNVQVVNMSLGGPSLFPGRDLFDQAADVLVAHDIVLVTSAGNAGPSSLTIGSPGSSFGTLTVGAASHAHNERILRDLQFGLGIGSFFRPFGGTQAAFFSSRGPNADSRTDPDVTASGFASIGQGFSPSVSGISIASGTSFSSPSVAGVAALLRQAFPGATARQIRNAIIASANPGLLSDGSINLDRGNGFVDGLAAGGLLAGGSVPDALPTPPGFVKSVKVNIENGTSLDVRNGFVVEHVSNLLPGQRAEIPYRVNPNTAAVVVQLFNVTPSLPPADQNVFFGDDILLAVHSAKTSRQPGDGDYQVLTFTTGGTFPIINPEPGVLRVTLNGDWTNAGTVSADVAILSLAAPVPQITQQGKLADGDFVVIPVAIPAGVSEAQFRLAWREDWGNYPTADLDMFIFDPGANFVAFGASLDNPEHAAVESPVAGTWFVLLDGFEVPSGTDKFVLRVSADGRVLR